jgi:glyoxylase-like metal-dependent hydrolase (beta-lactamase superfamily II)
MNALNPQLTWQVFTSAPLRTLGDDPPPGEEYRIWPPISSTLIAGENDAVLVDAPATVTQARALGDRVAASTKNLTSIYITHGHPDHWFGTAVLLDRFPAARVVALPSVVGQMRKYLVPDVLQVWHERFPGEIPGDLAVAEELSGGVGEAQVEGRELVPIALGHTDTDDTTCLYVPSLSLVAAGDAVYNGVYLQLRESTPATRQEWIAALDVIEALHPAVVIAGHKAPGADDTPGNIDETRRYIRVFEQVLAEQETALGVYQAMISHYPERAFPGALWQSASELTP